MRIVFDIEKISSQVIFGSGLWLAFKELGELPNISNIRLLRPFFLAVKLKILLKANEDRRQRIFVDGHSETPRSNASVQRRFELNVGNLVASRRYSHCFREDKDKDVMQ